MAPLNSTPQNYVRNDEKLRETKMLLHCVIIMILELTVCHELNLLNCEQYKLNKYKDLRDDLL